MNVSDKLQEIEVSPDNLWINENIREKVIVIDGEITSATTIEVYLPLFHYNRYTSPSGIDNPIRLIINSQGGDLGVALCLADMVSTSKLWVRSIGLSRVYSGALLPLIASQERQCYAHTEILVHSPQYEVSMSPIENQTATHTQMTKLDDCMWGMIEKYTKIRKRKYIKSVSTGIWLTAAEAKKLGVIDRIL